MLNMPQWLVDFWTVYGDMITPVLVTLLCSVVTFVALKIKSDAKTNSAKADLQVEILKDVANREDNKPQLAEQSQRINELEKTISNLAEMFNLAFQNANIDPEIKNNLAALTNKIKYGTEDELVKELEDLNNKYKQEIETLKQQLENTLIVAPTETTTRTRR